jgi:RimJ/RimL family protein N-acetyltransferase
MAVGTVQATVSSENDRLTAHVAWVIGVTWQGQGIASEAARTLVDWLRQQDVHDIAAHIHPSHRASERVAARAGFVPTDDAVDGERVWRLTPDA